MTSVGPSQQQPSPADQAFVSEVFHELSQPLTALQCVLELSLRRDNSVAELRASVEKALENADRLRQRLTLIRALNESYDAGEPGQKTDLTELVQELCEDMVPLFASGSQRLEVHLQSRPMIVRAERGRISRSLFCFLEYLFRYSAPNSITCLRLDVMPDRSAEIRISSQASLPVALQGQPDRLAYSFESEMMRRSFRAVAGSFAMVAGDHGRESWRGILLPG